MPIQGILFGPSREQELKTGAAARLAGRRWYAHDSLGGLPAEVQLAVDLMEVPWNLFFLVDLNS